MERDYLIITFIRNMHLAEMSLVNKYFAGIYEQGLNSINMTNNMEKIFDFSIIHILVICFRYMSNTFINVFLAECSHARNGVC